MQDLECPLIVPNRNVPIADQITRFSDAHITHPAIILRPKTIDHVVSAMGYADKNKLIILVGGGGHGTFVEMSSNTLYMDMSNFQNISLNEEMSTVEVGGGTLTGNLLKTLAYSGYYTTVANANAVGVVGAVIGGGNSVYNCIHGYMVDQVTKFVMVTAKGLVVDISTSSQGEELMLFNALRGAGHGLGVIVSMTMKMYKIKPLGLDDGRIWATSLIFPGTELDAVANAFTSLQPPDDRLHVHIAFARAPQSTAGESSAALIVVSALYFGPTADAEKAAVTLLYPALTGKALKVDRSPLAFENMNDALERLYSHGGARSTNGCRFKYASVGTIASIFQLWAAFTENGNEKATVVIQNFNPGKLVQNGQSSEAYLECRDWGFILISSLHSSSEEAMDNASDGFVNDILAAARRLDTEAGLAPRTIPNTMKFNQELSEMFPEQRILELKRMKDLWDPAGLFWSPYKL